MEAPPISNKTLTVGGRQVFIARCSAVEALDRPLAVAALNAGRSLGGYDYATEKSGHGVAVATGWQAGRMAAAAASGESL